MSRNWKNEKLCGYMTPAGRSVFTKFGVFPISTSVDITVCYIYAEKRFIFFLSYSTRNTKSLQRMSDGNFPCLH